MKYGKTIGVVIPAFNEEEQIAKVLETMPDFVDRMIVVDDGSRDQTAEIVASWSASRPDRVVLLRHQANLGVGRAVATGYGWARENGLDVTVVMDGDHQMAPEDLREVVRPVALGVADYVKGNRLVAEEAWRRIPRLRFLGNSVLTMLTKLASGYWHLTDSQSGYTAISLGALRRLDLDRIYPRYGVYNDLLVRLNVNGCRAVNVNVRPVYEVGEKSKMRIPRVTVAISALLFRLFWRRMWLKYVVLDFHPLLFFYLMSLVLIPLGLLLGILIIIFNTNLFGPPRPLNTGFLILCALLLISGFQALFFGMWFDMEHNRHLFVYDHQVDEAAAQRGVED